MVLDTGLYHWIQKCNCHQEVEGYCPLIVIATCHLYWYSELWLCDLLALKELGHLKDVFVFTKKKPPSVYAWKGRNWSVVSPWWSVRQTEKCLAPEGPSVSWLGSYSARAMVIEQVQEATFIWKKLGESWSSWWRLSTGARSEGLQDEKAFRCWANSWLVSFLSFIRSVIYKHVKLFSQACENVSSNVEFNS